MEQQVVIDGIRRFAENLDALLTEISDELFEVAFPDEPNPVIITIEALGFMISYATYCGQLRDASVAPTLMQRNWGGVHSSCFYFSVHVQDGKPWLVLETRQVISELRSAEDVASTLGFCRFQSRQARETFDE